MTANEKIMAMNQLPEWVKFHYTNHAIQQAKIKSRDVVGALPSKVKKSECHVVKAWFDGQTLVKCAIQVDIGLNKLALEIIYLPMAKQVKTVYKTAKKF